MALCLVGAVMVFSASAVTAREQYGNGYHFLLRQLLWLGLGLVAMFAMINLDYRRLRAAANSCSRILFVVLIMLVGVFSWTNRTPRIAGFASGRPACSLRNWPSWP